MMSKGTVVLKRSDISSLLAFEDYFQAVESAFRAHGQGKVLSQGLLHFDSPPGEFHVKAGGLALDRAYFALKNNGGFSQNPKQNGLPSILGTITLCDGNNGYPLAIMDSSEITRQRTAAAAAVAAKYLARPDSTVITICGCGTQGNAQLRAAVRVLPIKKAFAFDLDHQKSRQFAAEMSKELAIEVQPVDGVGPAIGGSQVCITCTPSYQFYVPRQSVAAGTFIAAMGADSPNKQELDPSLLPASKVVVDILEQCERAGELHHAIEGGLMARDDIHGELGEIVAGRKPGRTSTDEITIFDSTGTAMQDVAAAAMAYSKAVEKGRGTWINLMA